MKFTGWRFTKSQEKIKYVMYVEDIKIFAKNKIESKFLIQLET